MELGFYFRNTQTLNTPFGLGERGCLVVCAGGEVLKEYHCNMYEAVSVSQT